jgi:pyruvate formate lyase activating enzyme
MGVAEVMREIVADRSFYQSSGGGVTLSGGEPLAQPEFCGALLWAIKAEGLHAAIETAGNVAWSVLEAVLPHLDLVMMDIKHMDPEKHREATGVTNTLVIENATRLAAGGVPLVFRTPVIPGFNDTEEALGAIARFVRTLIVRRMSIGTEGTGGTAPIAYELLPHHPLAGDKYHSLGKENRAAGLSVMAEAEMERLREHVARIVQSREEGRVG